jgi:uncharacterized cupredoxin-like copper-binding protein
MPVTTPRQEAPVKDAEATTPYGSNGDGRYGDESTQATMRRKLWIALGAGGGAALIVVAIVIAFSGGSNHGSSAASSQSTPATPAPAPSAPAPATGTVNATLQEFSITPSSTTARAGSVTFAVRNAGHVPHELVVIRTDKPASALLGPGGRAVEDGNVGETGDLAPGATKSVKLKLTPGHYALICNLPGHYAAGQHVDFTVR